MQRQLRGKIRSRTDSGLVNQNLFARCTRRMPAIHSNMDHCREKSPHSCLRTHGRRT